MGTNRYARLPATWRKIISGQGYGITRIISNIKSVRPDINRYEGTTPADSQKFGLSNTCRKAMRWKLNAAKPMPHESSTSIDEHLFFFDQNMI
jgi:hypothetical protein